MAEAGEGFEDVFDAIDLRAFESLRSVAASVGSGEDGECGADGLGLFGEGFRPREFARRAWRRRSGFAFAGGESGLRRGACRVLEGGAEVADLAGAFFGGALGVQGAKVGEDGVVARGGREGVGFGDGGVEVVVELAEDGDEALFVGELFLGVERGAGAEFFEDVVAGR